MSELFFTSPSLTLTPAIWPIFDILNTSSTSHVPWLSSFVSGANNPFVALLTKSKAS